jgi:hypothetical protein
MHVIMNANQPTHPFHHRVFLAPNVGIAYHIIFSVQELNPSNEQKHVLC